MASFSCFFFKVQLQWVLSQQYLKLHEIVSCLSKWMMMTKLKLDLLSHAKFVINLYFPKLQSPNFSFFSGEYSFIICATQPVFVVSPSLWFYRTKKCQPIAVQSSGRKNHGVIFVRNEIRQLLAHGIIKKSN